MWITVDCRQTGDTDHLCPTNNLMLRYEELMLMSCCCTKYSLYCDVVAAGEDPRKKNHQLGSCYRGSSFYLDWLLFYNLDLKRWICSSLVLDDDRTSSGHRWITRTSFHQILRVKQVKMFGAELQFLKSKWQSGFESSWLHNIVKDVACWTERETCSAGDWRSLR